jgi:two-component system response regulator HydG
MIDAAETLLSMLSGQQLGAGARSALEAAGFAVLEPTDWHEVLRLLRRQDRAVILTIGDGPPDEIRRRLVHEHPGSELVYVDGEGELTDEVRRAIRRRDRRLDRVQLHRAITRERGFAAMLGTSTPMQEMFELVEGAASTRATVLITGESGTGKELVARALHQRSRRSAQPFVALNCSAVPPTLLESELFGHVRGAFTDARESRSGLFVKASGGTLFLDEIGDLPLELQPKLLRALQERSVRPVGGDREIEVDVRVVAATNRDLEEAVQSKQFREDLFYRLNVIHIEVPPLRERAADILLLAESFARSCARDLGKEVFGLSRAAGQRLLAYGWPGNVRELQNSVERAVALCRDDLVGVEDLPPRLRQQPLEVEELAVPVGEEELVPLSVIERRYIERVLDAVGGNRKAAARILGVDRKTLYRKLVRYRLEDEGGTDAPHEDRDLDADDPDDDDDPDDE